MHIESKNWFYILLITLLIADLAILLNIPFLRQIMGFLFLTILPGLLILLILKLNKIGYTENIVLSVGLSISFLMFFGLLLNYSSLSLGYETPLAITPLLISFNLAFVLSAIVAYKLNKAVVFSLPNFNLTASEKAFLIVPILFPALSIFGMNLMNTTDNNIILMFLLLSIPAYVAFVCFFNQKFPKRLYPVVIFLISISLLLLLSLRSNHLIGNDTHQEYYLFQTTLDNLHWRVFVMGNALDACLSISLLPTIYQSILNISPEFLFKILYSLIYSIAPLVIYVLSKKYIGESYAFLASFFLMSQGLFLYTAANSRTSMAILFFGLAMMTLFNNNIDPLKKRILFIVFMASCMVSHYSTTYIFFFIMLGTFIGVEILSKKYTSKKVISLTIMILFFALIFFWYSQVTETAFNAGVGFIENMLANLNDMFIEESRSESIQSMFGEKLTEEEIPYKINFFFNWAAIAFIGIGIITLLIRYREMSFPELNFKKPDFLREKFEVVYFMIALTCTGILIAVVALPHITEGYDLSRSYSVAIVILSTFFVIGGIMIAKYLNQFIAVLQGKASTENTSQVRAYLIILLVLIPYFLSIMGVTYAMFGEPRSVILSSEGEQYDMLYVHDQESYSAKWLKESAEESALGLKVYGDPIAVTFLTSQGTMALFREAIPITKPGEVNNYVYCGYRNVVDKKFYAERKFCNMTEYSIIFVGKSKIYDNNGSEIYR